MMGLASYSYLLYYENNYLIFFRHLKLILPALVQDKILLQINQFLILFI